jgi:hypothetical protein
MSTEPKKAQGAFLVGDQVPEPLRRFFADMDNTPRFWERSGAEVELDRLFQLPDTRD